MTQPAYLKGPCARSRPRRITTSFVTDHALVRWLERVKGIDIEAFRALARVEMCTKEKLTDSALIRWIEDTVDLNIFRRAILDECGDAALVGASRVNKGFYKYVIMNGIIVTVLT